MLQSNEFDPRVFQDPTEGQLQDRKVELYPLLSDNQKLGEFIKDVIALANSARQRGRDAYILFGVDDNRIIVGIEGQDIKSPPRHTANGTTEADIEKHQGEIIGRVLLRKIKDYIGPLHARYEYGYADSHLVSYLCLPGRTSVQWYDTPYQIAQDIFGSQPRERIYTQGRCWTRMGESNVEVNESEKKNLYCYERMPYVGSAQWLRYAHEVNKLFSDPDQGSPIPLQCEYGRVDEQDLLETMHACLQDHNSRIIVCNTPGSGKTTALKQFTCDLAHSLEGHAATLHERKEDVEPTVPIPVYFSLEGYAYAPSRSIMQCLLNDIKQKGIMINENFDQLARLFNNQNMHFVILLDSFDEMDQDKLVQNRRAVQTFIEEMTNRMTVFIGCRSTFIEQIPKRHSFQDIKVLPAQERLIYDYLEQRMKSISELVSLLQVDEDFQDLYSLIARPRMLEAMRDYIDDSADEQEQIEGYQFRLFFILNHIIPYVIRLEHRKHPFLGIINEDRAVKEIIQKLENIAVEMATQRRIRSIHSQDHDLLDWCSRSNLLCIESREVRFVSPLVRDYFIATGIVSQGRNVNTTTLPNSKRVRSLMREAHPQTRV